MDVFYSAPDPSLFTPYRDRECRKACFIQGGGLGNALGLNGRTHS